MDEQEIGRRRGFVERVKKEVKVRPFLEQHTSLAD
jgi:hypothetical protein